MYTFFRDAVTAFLSEYCLIYTYDLPLSTPVYGLLEQTAQAMKDSPLKYVFDNQNTSTRTRYLGAHETVPLQLLGLVARGIPRRAGEVGLQPVPISAQFTLQDLALDRNKYASPLCIEDSRLTVHCSK